MVHRNIEESLNLRCVQIDQQGPVRTGRTQQIRHQLGRNRHARPVLAVLPCVAVVRHYNRNPAGRCALQRVDHDQQFHQVLIHGVGRWAEPETHPRRARSRATESKPRRRRTAAAWTRPAAHRQTCRSPRSEARLADPQKILKRLSSLSLGERFRSAAVLAPSVADFDASGIDPSGDGFGAGWGFFSGSSACPEIGERTAVVVWLFTSKPSRLVDLGSSCCFTSYGALFCVATSPCEIESRLGPSNFCF